MYYLSEASNPPPQKFVDPSKDRYPTLPFYDERYFQDIYDIVSVEPVKEQDKVMMGMLASLGIVDRIQVISLEAAVKADNMRPLERVCIPLLYVLPTAKHCVVLVVCLVQLPMKLTGLINRLGHAEKITLLDYSRIRCVLLLSEGRQSEADCQSD
jgi:hypothetical protein